MKIRVMEIIATATATVLLQAASSTSKIGGPLWQKPNAIVTLNLMTMKHIVWQLGQNLHVNTLPEELVVARLMRVMKMKKEVRHRPELSKLLIDRHSEGVANGKGGQTARRTVGPL